MFTSTPVARLIQILTGETWSARKRNAAAHEIARLRSGVNDDPLVRVRHQIVQHGVVGRYDRSRAELLKILAETGGCVAGVESESFLYQGKRRRYSVQLFGHRSDVDRAIALHQELMTMALAELVEITGKNVAARRRAWFDQFLHVLSVRLADIGTAPSMEWLKGRHDEAVTENSGVTDWHREMA